MRIPSVGPLFIQVEGTKRPLKIFQRILGVMGFLWKKNPELGEELINLLKNTVYQETVAKSVNPE